MLGGQPELFIPSADMLGAFEKKPAVAWIKTGRSLATFLRKLGLPPGHNADKTQRGYTVIREWFEDMSKRYSSLSDTPEASEASGESEKLFKLES